MPKGHFMKITYNTGLSLFFIIFFSFSIFQVLHGKREDWPFSYFGMYSGRLYPTDVYRMDLDLILGNGTRLSVFDLPINYSHMSELMEKYQFLDFDNIPENVRIEIDEILEKDIISQLDYLCQSCNNAKEIVLRRRYWKNFVQGKKPDEDVILHRRPLSSTKTETLNK